MTAIDLHDANEFLEPQSGDAWLRNRGETMAPEIQDGDWLLGRPREPETNEIVVAVVDDRTTVRRYRRDGDTVHLLADNDTIERISRPASEVRVLGVVVGLVRRLP